MKHFRLEMNVQIDEGNVEQFMEAARISYESGRPATNSRGRVIPFEELIPSPACAILEIAENALIAAGAELEDSECSVKEIIQ